MGPPRQKKQEIPYLGRSTTESEGSMPSFLARLSFARGPKIPRPKTKTQERRTQDHKTQDPRSQTPKTPKHKIKHSSLNAQPPIPKAQVQIQAQDQKFFSSFTQKLV